MRSVCGRCLTQESGVENNETNKYSYEANVTWRLCSEYLTKD